MEIAIGWCDVCKGFQTVPCLRCFRKVIKEEPQEFAFRLTAKTENEERRLLVRASGIPHFPWTDEKGEVYEWREFIDPLNVGVEEADITEESESEDGAEV